MTGTIPQVWHMDRKQPKPMICYQNAPLLQGHNSTELVVEQLQATDITACTTRTAETLGDNVG